MLFISAVGSFAGFPAVVLDRRAAHLGVARRRHHGDDAAHHERSGARHGGPPAAAPCGSPARSLAFAGEGRRWRRTATRRAARSRATRSCSAACVMCACGFAAGGRLAQRIDPLAATLWAIAVASLGFLPAAVLMVGTVDWPALGPVTWVALLHITAGASVLAYVSWFWALSRGGIARVATFQFAQPALVLVFAALILGEPMPAQLIVAGARRRGRHRPFAPRLVRRADEGPAPGRRVFRRIRLVSSGMGPPRFGFWRMQRSLRYGAGDGARASGGAAFRRADAVGGHRLAGDPISRRIGAVGLRGVVCRGPRRQPVRSAHRQHLHGLRL